MFSNCSVGIYTKDSFLQECDLQSDYPLKGQIRFSCISRSDSWICKHYKNKKEKWDSLRMKSIDLHIQSQRWDVLEAEFLHWKCVYVVGDKKYWGMLPIQ